MNLIIYPPNSRVLFNFFGIDIYWYGLILTISILIGFIYVYFLLRLKVGKPEARFFLDFCPNLIINSIIGARLFYILGSFQYYLNNPIDILLIHNGGLSIFGAIIFGLLYLIIYLKLNKKSSFLYLDLISLIMPLCQAIGRFGNYFNQEAFGKPTSCFLTLYVDKQYRPVEYQDYSYFMPTFLYEAFLNFAFSLILNFIYFKNKNIKSGLIFSVYLIGYGLIRLFIEFFRIDSILNLGKIHIASVLSLILIFLGILTLILNKKMRAN